MRRTRDCQVTRSHLGHDSPDSFFSKRISDHSEIWSDRYCKSQIHHNTSVYCIAGRSFESCMVAQSPFFKKVNWHMRKSAKVKFWCWFLFLCHCETTFQDGWNHELWIAEFPGQSSCSSALEFIRCESFVFFSSTENDVLRFLYLVWWKYDIWKPTLSFLGLNIDVSPGILYELFQAFFNIRSTASLGESQWYLSNALRSLKTECLLIYPSLWTWPWKLSF